MTYSQQLALFIVVATDLGVSNIPFSNLALDIFNKKHVLPLHETIKFEESAAYAKSEILRQGKGNAADELANKYQSSLLKIA